MRREEGERVGRERSSEREGWSEATEGGRESGEREEQGERGGGVRREEGERVGRERGAGREGVE